MWVYNLFIFLQNFRINFRTNLFPYTRAIGIEYYIPRPFTGIHIAESPTSAKCPLPYVSIIPLKLIHTHRERPEEFIHLHQYVFMIHSSFDNTYPIPFRDQVIHVRSIKFIFYRSSVRNDCCTRLVLYKQHILIFIYCIKCVLRTLSKYVN